jgi:acyl carrier protein
LGEIESCLHTLPHIKQAVVVDFDGEQGKFLAAYLVYEQGSEVAALSEEELVNELSQKLPDYMIPSTFTTLEKIPLTQNGKLDRRSLPEPESIRSETYVGPRNELEEKLCNIWQEVLGIEKVGIHDSFFRLGGDSMKAIQMTSVGRKNAGLEISLPLLFKHKSIFNLAQHLEEREVIVIQSADLDKKISSQNNKMKL